MAISPKSQITIHIFKGGWYGIDSPYIECEGFKNSPHEKLIFSKCDW
jgi:hypothetical protein